MAILAVAGLVIALLKEVKTGKCHRINAKGTKLIKTNKSGLKKKYK